ncbi:MAG: BrnT family toxin [Proteobacteria bacterium]|nr:BrnT family toxin [Pseudomonadota bacterium]
MDLEFEWDEEKRAYNIREHKVDFRYVVLIFNNAILEEINDRDNYGEERIIAYGHIEGTVYRVVYTMRGKTFRLISAQKAERHDQERYYKTVFHG